MRNIDEAVQWLGCTYLYVPHIPHCMDTDALYLTSIRYVHMLKYPSLYGIGVDYQQERGWPKVCRHCSLSCSASRYKQATGQFQSTELGWIASHYYVTYASMGTYNQHLKPTMLTLKLVRVFAMSNEFRLCWCVWFNPGCHHADLSRRCGRRSVHAM